LFSPRTLPATDAAGQAVIQQLQAIGGLAALFAVLGHMFPIWLKFRGGKGVATAAGAFLGVSPVGLGLAFIVFLIVFVASRYVSLASVCATIAFPPLAYFFSYRSLVLLVFMIAVAVLIIAKHHANIRRLLAGTENRFGKKKVAAQIAAED
jgi:glycerol-3-phosphate acyltransferase PlsY